MQLRGISDPCYITEEHLHSSPKIRLPLIQTPNKENHQQENYGQHAYQRVSIAALSSAVRKTENQSVSCSRKAGKESEKQAKKSRKVARCCLEAGNKYINKTEAIKSPSATSHIALQQGLT